MKQTIKILHILPDIDIGDGLARVVTSWHENINRELVQFDYLLFCDAQNNLIEKINACGGKVFLLPNPNKKIFAFLFSAFIFFKKHHYQIVHSHITQFNLFYFPLAKLFGTKYIILHSHSTTYSGSKIKSWLNKMMLAPVRPFITHRIATSQEAGDFLFGKNNFEVIFNGIAPNNFVTSPMERKHAKEIANLSNFTVLGHVGRFSKEKNHTFLLQIFCAYKKINPNARLLLIGKGPLENVLHKQIQAMHMEKEVTFISHAAGKELYAAMDILVFPSLSEGFGLVPIEARAAGLPVLVSQAIPKQVRKTALLDACEIKQSPQIWASHIDKLLHPLNVPFEFPDELNIKHIALQIQNYYLTKCAL